MTTKADGEKQLRDSMCDFWYENGREDHHKERDGHCAICVADIDRAKSEEREKIKMLIIEECNVARSEGEKTSRLTSLWNKIDAKLAGEDVATD